MPPAPIRVTIASTSVRSPPAGGIDKLVGRATRLSQLA